MYINMNHVCEIYIKQDRHSIWRMEKLVSCILAWKKRQVKEDDDRAALLQQPCALLDSSPSLAGGERPGISPLPLSVSSLYSLVWQPETFSHFSLSQGCLFACLFEGRSGDGKEEGGRKEILLSCTARTLPPAMWSGRLACDPEACFYHTKKRGRHACLLSLLPFTAHYSHCLSLLPTPLPHSPLHSLLCLSKTPYASSPSDPSLVLPSPTHFQSLQFGWGFKFWISGTWRLDR